MYPTHEQRKANAATLRKIADDLIMHDQPPVIGSPEIEAARDLLAQRFATVAVQVTFWQYDGGKQGHGISVWDGFEHHTGNTLDQAVAKAVAKADARDAEAKAVAHADPDEAVVAIQLPASPASPAVLVDLADA
jgi:hypothetical protein